MITDKRYMLSDRNIRVILFIKTCYQNLRFDNKEINELYMKKEMVIFWIIFDVAIFIFSYLGIKRSEKSGS